RRRPFTARAPAASPRAGSSRCKGGSRPASTAPPRPLPAGSRPAQDLQRRRREPAARLPHRRPPSLSLTLFLPLQMPSLTVAREKEKGEIERIALRAPRGATRAAADLFFW